MRISTILSGSFVAFVTFVSVGSAGAQTRSITLPSLTGTTSSASATTTPAVTKIAPAASLPSCGSGIEDKMLVWDAKAKKWNCKSLLVSPGLPPKCDGVDQALRFDGKQWKCETVSGLLVGYASGTYWPGNLVGTSKCDAGAAWGAGSCKNISDKAAKLSCTPTTHRFELWSPSTDMGGNPIQNMHVFCYSKRITVK